MELILNGLSHSAGQLSVLHGIDLHIASGEIVAVLGPSGCGKSTLLRLVGGLEQPTSGDIRVRAGKPGDAHSPITYVFQDATLLPWRTVAGNVALPLAQSNLSQSEKRRRVTQVLERVNLADFATAYPGQLSGGMRQRCSIARALVVDPAVLLMDEPLASLDAQTREILLSDLTRLWGERPYTCLYVTHSPAEAVRMGHRVVVLSPRPGQIREILHIDVPLHERSETHPDILAARTRLWDLVRDDALKAERDVHHVD